MIGSPPRRVGSKIEGALLLLASLLLAGGCATTPAPDVTPAVTVDEPEDEPAWRSVVQRDDLALIELLPQTWSEALAAARSAGQGRRVRAEGDLLDPDAALLRPAPAPGSYRCRVIRIRSGVRGRAAYRVTGPFFCFVGADGPMLSFTQQTGSVRPGGYFHEDSDRRLVFVGAAARGRETVPPAYGDDSERDVVGVVERVGDFRYRLVLPQRGDAATLEVYELVPAPR